MVTRGERQKPIRWLSAIVPAFALLVSCSLIASFEREDQVRPNDSGPDGALDADGDADTDSDADGDVDSDTDTDTDSDAHGDSGVIESIRATPRWPGPYPAGTSVIIDLEPVWYDDVEADISVSMTASDGGLVSLENEFGSRPFEWLRVEGDGYLPTIRLTFPLEPWPNTTTLQWEPIEGGDPTPVAGVAEYEVTEPVIELTPIEDETDQFLRIPRGLCVERFIGVDSMFAGTIDEGHNRIYSMTFTWDDSSSEMVVAAEKQLCFISRQREHDCVRTLPSSGVATTGPDSIRDIVFFDSDDSSRGLYGVSSGQDGESAYSGLFLLGRDGGSEMLYGVNHAQALYAASHENPFRTSMGPAIYFYGEGELLAWDMDDDQLVSGLCTGEGVYPTGLALGNTEVYEDRPLFIARREVDGETGDDVTLVDSLETGCSRQQLAQLRYVGTHPSTASASPGMVFGRMVYVAAGNEIALMVSDLPAETVVFKFLRLGGDLIEPRDIAFMPVISGTNFHPPGMYILDFQGGTERILRIYQDLNYVGE